MITDVDKANAMPDKVTLNVMYSGYGRTYDYFYEVKFIRNVYDPDGKKIGEEVFEGVLLPQVIEYMIDNYTNYVHADRIVINDYKKDGGQRTKISQLVES